MKKRNHLGVKALCKNGLFYVGSHECWSLSGHRKGKTLDGWPVCHKHKHIHTHTYIQFNVSNSPTHVFGLRWNPENPGEMPEKPLDSAGTWTGTFSPWLFTVVLNTCFFFLSYYVVENLINSICICICTAKVMNAQTIWMLDIQRDFVCRAWLS